MGAGTNIAEQAALRHFTVMNLPIRAPILAILPLAITGCAERTEPAPFKVLVRGPASSCTTEVEGRTVTTEELLEIARRAASPGRPARIDGNMAETPYRCIGGTLFTLQRAGFKDVDFIGPPPFQKP